MSTIFGIFNRYKRILENSNIQLMDNALAYWDPDDRGIWNESSIAFGHRMLWNTPESKLEHLPRIISSENKTFVITIDARLDNREILVEQLEMTALSLEKITDSELILAAYRKWGEECPKYLLGDFVFAIWDADKEYLFCARDHIGIKPFYYHLSDGLFVFSNDIRGVIAHPEVSKTYNDRSIAMFLGGIFGFYDKKDTFYEEIQKLPAATSMIITKEQVTESVYWDIEDISEVHYDTYEAYVEKLRELLLDAVKVRLRTTYPTASHLSGGLDSSAIAVLAARELEKRDQTLYAFNWIETPDGVYDPDHFEWGFATQIADLENIEQKNIKLTAEFIAEMYDTVDIAKDDITRYWEEYLIRDEAEKYKIRTILSGWGGDELISYDGYAYLPGLFSQGHFLKAVKEIALLYKDKNYKYLRIFKRSLRELLYPIFYKQMSGLYQEVKLDSDPFALTKEPFSSFTRKFSFKDIDFHAGVHNDQKALFAFGHTPKRIENWASSAIGKKLEYSYPLLDKRIVEFALAIPEELYARKDGHQRYFFRSAISDLLPKRIAWQRKVVEIKHGEAIEKKWQKALNLWMQKNEKREDLENAYVDRSKIMERLKIYFSNKEKGVEGPATSGTLASILLLNFKNQGD